MLSRFFVYRMIRAMTAIPIIETPRTTMTIGQPQHARAMLAYLSENRAHLEPWEPLRSNDFYTLAASIERLDQSIQSFESGSAMQFIAFDKVSGEIVAACNFANIIRRVYQACHLGYSIGKKWEGQGLMVEIVEAGIRHMFDVVQLHRVMANHMPNNVRSEQLLKRLGFEREGYAKSYLKIAGRWEDMVLNSKVNPAN